MTIFLKNEQATLDFAAKLAAKLPKKGVIFLYGSLGAGKTTLVRGILRAAGHKGSTKSPTYTLVEPYQLVAQKFYHFDLYRIADPEELEYMGMRDYLDENCLSLIEWPEKGRGFLPEADLEISLSYEGEARSIKLEAVNPEWQSVSEITADETSK